jgi:hypothetical protein
MVTFPVGVVRRNSGETVADNRLTCSSPYVVRGLDSPKATFVVAGSTVTVALEDVDPLKSALSV